MDEEVTLNDFVCAVGEMTEADALQRVKHLVRVETALRRVMDDCHCDNKDCEYCDDARKLLSHG